MKNNRKNAWWKFIFSFFMTLFVVLFEIGLITFIINYGLFFILGISVSKIGIAFLVLAGVLFSQWWIK